MVLFLWTILTNAEAKRGLFAFLFKYARNNHMLNSNKEGPIESGIELTMLEERGEEVEGHSWKEGKGDTSCMSSGVPLRKTCSKPSCEWPYLETASIAEIIN